jgi:hypothetical protein
MADTTSDPEVVVIPPTCDPEVVVIPPTCDPEVVVIPPTSDPELGGIPPTDKPKSLVTRFLQWQPPKDVWYITWARRSKLPALKEAAKKDVHVLIR